VVDGPEKIMENLQELYTETIDLGGRSEDFFGQFDILLEDPRMVIRGAGTTEFHGIIKRLIIIRSFENLPIAINNLSEDFTAIAEIVSGSIRVQGNQNELEGYNPAGTILSVDCSRITAPGNYILPVHVNIPSQFTFRSDPSAVTVQVYAK
jgi:hypothetical protein